MNFFTVIKKRRSIRDYKDRPLKEKTLQRILEAINQAPSAGNLQAYEVYLVTDEDRKAKLVKASGDQKFIARVPVVLIFCSHPARAAERYKERGIHLYAVQDASIACTFAMLAACALGLGTVWIGAFNEDQVWRIIGSPDGQIPVAMLPIGYPEKKTYVRKRRPIEELVHRIE